MPHSDSQLPRSSLRPKSRRPSFISRFALAKRGTNSFRLVCPQALPGMAALLRAAPWTMRLLGISGVGAAAAVASAEDPAERARSLVYIPLRVSRSVACGVACVAGKTCDLLMASSAHVAQMCNATH